MEIKHNRFIIAERISEVKLYLIVTSICNIFALDFCALLCYNQHK